ncbi:MAG TPA: hypothetical protein VHB77_13660, partial [Planctomycetaceae bacterium]|nr:hypothetical protein [Planctomycetaceae bacterium]
MKPRAEGEAGEHGEAPGKSESDWGLAPPKRRSRWETKFAVVVILGLLGAFGWLVWQKVQARQLALKNGEAEQTEDASGDGNPETVEGALAGGEPTLSATEDDPFVTPAAGTQPAAQSEPEFAEADNSDNPFAADAAAVANARQKVARAEETLLEANQELANDEFSQNRDEALAQQAKQKVARAEGDFAESQQELANDEFALNEDRAMTQQAKQKVAQAQADLAEAQQELSNDEFVLNEDRVNARETMPARNDNVPVTGDLEDAFETDADARAAVVP